MIIMVVGVFGEAFIFMRGIAASSGFVELESLTSFLSSLASSCVAATSRCDNGTCVFDFTKTAEQMGIVHFKETRNKMEDEADAILNQQLLAELRAVSDKSHQSRFSQVFEMNPRSQESSNQQQSFLDSTPENPELNQYWYSETTINVLCNAIMEQINDDGGKVAFLSTPTLYFALPPIIKSQCFLFDVSCGHDFHLHSAPMRLVYFILNHFLLQD